MKRQYKIKPIHPFPARMAPELVTESIHNIKNGSVILDPMAGSGTVLRHASLSGYHSIGFDTDPLAVLISKVWNTTIERKALDNVYSTVLKQALKADPYGVCLDWIDNDDETMEFIRFWFGQPQLGDLRKLAYILNKYKVGKFTKEEVNAANVLRVALSKLIIKKDKGASLGRDISHSRPHKVRESTDFEVFPSFEAAVVEICKILENEPPLGKVDMRRGDARELGQVDKESIDAVITSPPYLNAIDYIRGHKLSLVWLGYSINELREIRSNNVGAERRPDSDQMKYVSSNIKEAMQITGKISSRIDGMIDRYCEDIYKLMAEMARIVKHNGKLVLVVGNSCLKGKYIQNSEGFAKAAEILGFELMDKNERDLPQNRRYLPMPKGYKESLGKRMRKEVVLSFCKM